MVTNVVDAAKTLLGRGMFANATEIGPKSTSYCSAEVRDPIFEEKLIDLIYHLSTSAKVKLPK